ncbi:RCC1 domain-containing protein [Lujinxingia litoralis]|nr:hypothetical protein [Lujinxingia litoralis]
MAKRSWMMALGLSLGLCGVLGCGGDGDGDGRDDVGVNEDVGGEDAGDVGGEDGGDVGGEDDGGEDSGDVGGGELGVEVAGIPEGKTYFRSVSEVVVSCEESCEIACGLSLDGGAVEAVTCAEGEAFALEGLAYGAYRFEVSSGETVVAERSFEVHPPEWAQVSGGEGFSCAVLQDGHLVCFGAGEAGQLGDGGAVSRLEPVVVAGRWAEVDAGGMHACAIAEDGALYCWGSSPSGALGLGAEAEELVAAPEQVGEARDWLKVSAGATHSCGIRQGGALYCWGDNARGAVGVGNGEDVLAEPAPVEVAGVTGWLDVSAGEGFSCALTAEGALYCWGRTDAGVTGANNTDVYEPRAYEGALSALSLSAGSSHACGVVDLDADDDVYCWGDGAMYKLGTGETRREVSPSPRAPGATSLVSVVSGRTFTCGLTVDGALHCWGDNARGQLGYDPTLVGEMVYPAPVGEESWEVVASGAQHICGVKLDDKSLWCWGDNSQGQLGVGVAGEDAVSDAQPVVWPY